MLSYITTKFLFRATDSLRPTASVNQRHSQNPSTKKIYEQFMHSNKCPLGDLQRQCRRENSRGPGQNYIWGLMNHYFLDSRAKKRRTVLQSVENICL